MRPVLLVVDDDPFVVRAIERDLKSKYGKQFRILKSESGLNALELVKQLKLRNASVALFLVDQRMPQMTGVQLLERVMTIFPESKRVLLTAYADTEAAIRSINKAKIDYYLMKPWDPPEEHLYPVLNDLLDDWWISFRPPYEGIKVIGYMWSPKSYEIRHFLARNGIPYQWLDVEDNESHRLMSYIDSSRNIKIQDQKINETSSKIIKESVEETNTKLQPNRGNVIVDAKNAPISNDTGSSNPTLQSHASVSFKTPLVIFSDGAFIDQPTTANLAERIGLKTSAQMPFYDLIIIGGGPAGLASAVYGASEGLSTLLVERESPGGQAVMSSNIENYLGFPSGLTGINLARRAVAQAVKFGVEILTPQEAVEIRIDGPYRIVKLKNNIEIRCHALIIACGVSYRKLSDVEGLDKFTGAGVYYGASMSEALSAKNETVFIIGGANSAGQAAVHFSKYAKTVTLIVRGDSLNKSMSYYLINQINGIHNIHVLLESRVTAVQGENRLERVTIKNIKTGTHQTVPCTLLYIFIGAIPHTDLVSELVERDNAGFILTGKDLIKEGQKYPKGWTMDRQPFLLETNVPGIFAVGDVRYGSAKRVATGVGEGSLCVQLIHQYLKSVR